MLLQVTCYNIMAARQLLHVRFEDVSAAEHAAAAERKVRMQLALALPIGCLQLRGLPGL